MKMSDKHNLNYDVRELKLGSSFTNNKTSQYHTIKYDFKPASVDVNKMATVDVGTNNQVTVTVPHLDGAGVPQTVFKGNQRPYTKECVLIIDRVTGEITLEKLSSNIQVKKTRQESGSRPWPPGLAAGPAPADLTNTTQRSSSRTRVATTKRASAAPNGGVAPGVSGSAAGSSRPGGGPAGGPPSGGGPPGMVRSPPRVARPSPPQAAPWSGGGNSTLASLPMIGLDDAPAAALQPKVERAHDRPHADRPHADRLHADRLQVDRPHGERLQVDRSHADRLQVDRPHAERPQVDRHVPDRAPPPTAQAADDSSSSSSSDSDSGSDSDSDDDRPHTRPPPNGAAGGNARNPVPAGPAGAPVLPTDVLNDDLCLSESGSDSD